MDALISARPAAMWRLKIQLFVGWLGGPVVSRCGTVVTGCGPVGSSPCRGRRWRVTIGPRDRRLDITLAIVERVVALDALDRRIRVEGVARVFAAFTLVLRNVRWSVRSNIGQECGIGRGAVGRVMLRDENEEGSMLARLRHVLIFVDHCHTTL